MADIKHKKIPLQMVVLGALLWVLFTLVAFKMAPGADERAAMLIRDLSEQAQRAHEAGDEKQEIALLERAASEPQADRAILLRLLAAYERNHAAQAHYALISGHAGAIVSIEQLRGAAAFYQSEKMPTEMLSTLRRIVHKPGANVDDSAQLANALLAAKSVREASAAAAKAVSRLNAGANPTAAATFMRAFHDAGQTESAARFAKAWYAPSLSDKDLTSAAPFMIQYGGAGAVRSVLRKRKSTTPELQKAYVFATRMEASSSPAARADLTKEMASAWEAETPGPKRDAMLKDLFLFGDMGIVEGVMRRTGEWKRAPIRTDFVFAMKRAGRQAQLKQLLIGQMSQEGQDSDSARQLAELGAPQEAAILLKRAAAHAGPDSQAFTDLAYLWKSQNIAPDVPWMSAMAQSSAKSGNWIEAIQRTASADAAVSAVNTIEAQRPSATAPSVLVLRARYLGWKGDSAPLRKALGAAANAALDPAAASEMAHLSCAIGDTSSVQTLGAKFPAIAATDDYRRCWARLLASEARRLYARKDAKGALAKFTQAAGDGEFLSAQDYLDYAAAMHEVSGQSKAAPLYETALAKLGSNGSTTDRYVRASALTQLKRYAEARHELDELLKAQPSNRRAKLMLAEVKLAMGDYDGALQISETP